MDTGGSGKVGDDKRGSGLRDFCASVGGSKGSANGLDSSIGSSLIWNGGTTGDFVSLTLFDGACVNA
jgi:hypothetical protein